MQLVWTTTFSRTFKRLVRQKPQLRPQIEQILEQLLADPFHPSLKTHKLKGALAVRWSCSIDYSNRIIFSFETNPDSDEEELFLLTLGSHDDVY